MTCSYLLREDKTQISNWGLGGRGVILVLTCSLNENDVIPN